MISPSADRRGDSRFSLTTHRGIHPAERDVVVIGAGLAGLAATIWLAKQGLKVTLVTKGIGGLQLGQGTVDIVGYTPERVDDVAAAVDRVADWAPTGGRVAEDAPPRPSHPYTHFSGQYVIEACTWLRDLLGEDFLVGDGHHNVVLPTAVGALRPTAFYQPSMAGGVLGGEEKHLVLVGLARLKDFYPKLCADNLSRQQTPDGHAIHARAIEVDVEIRAGEMDTNGVNHARALDDPSNRKRLVDAVKPLIRAGETVGFPAVLGLNDPHAWRDIQQQLGHPVFEIPIAPPSVPGMRVNQALTEMVKSQARVLLGSKVRSVRIDETSGRVTHVIVGTAGAPRAIATKNVILAAGGFESGGLEMDSYGDVAETILGLPVAGTDGRLLHSDFWGADQPLFMAGVAVDDQMRPLDGLGCVVHPNVYVAGGALAGATRWREKSGEGIALASALRAAETIKGGIK